MEIKNLIEQATIVRGHSYSPYSKYKVGAAVLAESGRVYTGCNVEIVNWGGTICAERTAISAAISSGERVFRKIAIVTAGDEPGAPCGDCRQFMAEFTDGTLEVHLATIDGKKARYTLSELLPHAFTPANLKKS